MLRFRTQMVGFRDYDGRLNETARFTSVSSKEVNFLKGRRIEGDPRKRVLLPRVRKKERRRFQRG